ncbi:transient receptor potential cation channel subfamily M member-like 2 [Hydractinia symbiolongicarpus]|uniref:transient receptor potential cation channel subfamily M member-like 2 n=1 Tax=Hydractinia symbiolongicarpus TaxID=13093 RepID=UPI00254F52AB|nr:transient receptor potential cation channel subfamily M member-like 2 [Hydractinia symbiolongicarpus]
MVQIFVPKQMKKIQKTLTFQDVQEDFLKSLKSFGDIDNKDFEDDIYMQLFFYAVLSNMKYMTVLFLHYGGQTLAKILMANKLYGNIKEFYQNNKNTEEKTLVFRLNRNEQYFESLALSMLNEYSQEQELFTRRVLCQELENYGSKSCLALAASTDHIDFVAHDTCQIMLTENTWCGRIVLKGDSWLMHGLQVVSCLVPPLFLLLEYKTREMEKVEGKAKIHYESNQLRSKLKSYRQEKETYSDKTKETLSRVYYKGRYFYESPITKCAVNVVSYFIFLGFFAFVLTHKLEKKIKFSEWIVGLYIIAFIFEEIRQIIQAPVGRTLTQKLKNYFSSFLNILDVIALTLFIVAFILRSYTDKLIETRLLYAADIFFWIIRLLSVFSISPELGPYVEMIRRMIVDLLYFVFVLAVFLLAYGIARFAILSPMNNSTLRAVTAIFSVPYKQMYADSLDEVVMKAPSGLTVFNMDYSTLVIPIAKILMAGYTLLAAVLLLNLLIARFSYIYDGVQGDSRKIWKFNRYFTMQEYQNRSAVPLPFSLFPNIHVLATTFLNSKCLSRPKKTSDFTIDEQDELFGFERECLITCLSMEEEQKQLRKQEKEQKKNRERLEKKEKQDELHPELTSRLNLIEDQLKGIIMKEPEGDTRKRLASACDFHTTLKADVHYPLTDTKRVFVNEENIPWEVEFEDYKPNTPKTFFPSNDTDSDHPRNPRGRTGVAGKGLLKTFGPNEIVETLLTRWKPGLTGIEIGSSGLKILQVLVVKETKSGTINIPIGPVTKCESHRQEELIPPILSALFHVEVLSDKGLWLDDERKSSYAERCQEILSHGLELYNGPIEDPRNTDEAWIESVVINYHDQDGRVISKYLESKLASQLNLEWMDVSTRIPLGWRYIDYLKKIAMHCNAQF